jgi:hypothetical protein
MVATEAGKSPRTYVLMRDGSTPKAFGPEDFQGTLVSPDGNRVLGKRNDGYMILPFPGGQTPQALPFIRADEAVLEWTADSGSVYVAGISPSSVKVEIVDVKTGQRRLHHVHAPGDLSGVAFISPGHITPDGNFYLYGVGRTLSFLYVVDGLK